MKKILIITAILSLGLVSCEKVVDIDVPYEVPKLVINSLLNPDSSFSVHLSKSQYILDNALLQNLTDAKVRVYDGDNLLGEPQHTQNGKYILEGVRPVTGKTYTIKAEMAGMEPAKATEKVLPVVMVLEESLDTLNDNNEHSIVYSAEFKIQDPAADKNYYMIRLYSEETGYYYYNRQNQEEPEEFIYWRSLNVESPDPSLESNCMSECGLLMDDEFFNGKTYQIKITASDYNSYFSPHGDEQKENSIYLVLYNISESAYLYYKSMEQSRNAEGDPFSEPVKVYSNIEGGYGILTAVTPVYIKLTP